jgi:nitroreductase
VVTGDPEMKRQIREAAEEEERINYEGGRLPEHWREALEPLGTDWRKPFLETVPWIVVMFEERYGVNPDGSKRHNFYVKESCGIAAGMFITALHHMGLATLTHTPSPMAFLTKLLGRPENERPFCMFPIGYPADDCVVPDLRRKPLDEVMVEVGEVVTP